MSARTTVKSIQDIMRQDVGVDGDAQRLSQLCWMFFLKIIDDQDQQLEVMQDRYVSPIPTKLQWRTWAADPEGITGDALLAFINGELFPALKELPATGKTASRARVVRSVFEDAYNYMKSGQLMRQVVNKISGVDFNDLDVQQHFPPGTPSLLHHDIGFSSAADMFIVGIPTPLPAHHGLFFTPRGVLVQLSQKVTTVDLTIRSFGGGPDFKIELLDGGVSVNSLGLAIASGDENEFTLSAGSFDAFFVRGDGIELALVKICYCKNGGRTHTGH